MGLTGARATYHCRESDSQGDPGSEPTPPVEPPRVFTGELKDQTNELTSLVNVLYELGYNRDDIQASNS